MRQPARQVDGSANGTLTAREELRFSPFWLALAMIQCIVFIVHLNALRTPHVEGDEMVFTFLAERLAETPGSYHVRGELHGDAAQRFLHDAWEPILRIDLGEVDSASLMRSPPDARGQQHPQFDPAIYDRPIFFHPPVYPYLLAIARSQFGSDGGVLLSALVHCLTILLLALLGRMVINEEAGLIAAGLIAIESVSWVCGERLWIDGGLQATVTGAALSAVWSARRGGLWRFAAAGTALGLAGLTKLPAGSLAPAIALWWWCSERRPRVSEMLIYVAACLALLLPWLILMKIKYGSFLPSERPSDWLLDLYPRVRKTLERPASYYLVGLLAVSPVLVYCAAGWVRCWREKWLWMVTLWAMTFVMALTFIGKSGMGYQLRYLAPAMPALCLIAAGGLSRLPWAWRIPALALGAYTWYCGMHTALLPGAVDPAPVALSQYLQSIFGWNLAEFFPRMW
jgi:4-amino-4-deoxy-L-arabinose transferase-like glycosyltransferase